MAKQLIVKNKVVKAGIYKRMLAFLIDILALNLIVVLPFRGILAGIVPEGDFSKVYTTLSTNPELLYQLNAVYIMIGALSFLYFTISEQKLQQSLGKMLTGLYVVGADKKPGFFQIAIRNLFLLPVFPFILLAPIDIIFILFTKGHRRLSDIIAKTEVVEYERRLY